MKLNEMEIKKYEDYKTECFKWLETLRTKDGFFIASNGSNYQASWHRDNMMVNLAYLNNDIEKFKQTIFNTLKLLQKFEDKYTKLSSVLKYGDPTDSQYLIHAKFNPYTWDEIPMLQWNHRQFDNNALILINVYYGLKAGINFDEYKNIIQLLIDYTQVLFSKPNASSWEEENQIRTSSIALTLKALRCMKKYGYKVDMQCITQCQVMLAELHLMEHKHKNTDLMLLYLPFFNISDEILTVAIIDKVERDLLGNYGVRRYNGDVYYNRNGKEAQWTFGFNYLSIAYYKIGQEEISKMYLDKVINMYNDARLPELCYADNGEPNDNRVLAWTQAMMILNIDWFLGNKLN